MHPPEIRLWKSVICLPASLAGVGDRQRFQPRLLTLRHNAVGLDHLERVLQEPGGVAEGETLLRLRGRGERQRDPGAELATPARSRAVCLMVFSLCSPVVTKFLRRVPTGMLVPARNPEVKSTTMRGTPLDTEIRTPNVWTYDAFRKPAQTDLFAW